MSKPEMMLWLNDARGVYIPRDFASSFADRATYVANVKDEDWAILEAGPDHEHYWEAWDSVLCDAVVTDDKGQKFGLYQDGDLWLVPQGMEWDDVADSYVWREGDNDNP